MNDLQLYTINYKDGDLEGSENVFADNEEDALNGFTIKYPDYTIISIDICEKEAINKIEESNDKSYKKIKKSRKKENEEENIIIGANLKDTEKKEEKKQSKNINFDPRTISFGYKMFFILISMALFIYPLIGIIKLLNNDLFKDIVGKTSYELLTYFYLGAIIAVMLVSILEASILIYRYVKKIDGKGCEILKKEEKKRC